MTLFKRSIIGALLLSLAYPGMFAAQTKAKNASIKTHTSKTASTTTQPDEEEEEEVAEGDGEIISEGPEEEENAEMREGEVTIETSDQDDDIGIPVPSFIDQSRNAIALNGADWSKLRLAAKSHKLSPLSIINIGDSHIQADFGTGVTRDLLQYELGNAGRGLITPLKMSGTNQPNDYIFTSSDPYTAVKLMKAPWKMTMGFTGTSISPTTKSSSITIGTRDTEDYDPFSSLTLFHKGQMKVKKITDERGADVVFTQYPSRDYTYIRLGSPQTRVTIQYDNLGDLTIFGANLSGERPGAFYHTIGNNGATYDTYNRIGDVGRSLQTLQPDLVILSLGTNEAFGTLDVSRFRANLDKLVKDIQNANPKAQIMLVTPMECQRTVTKTVTKKVPVTVKSKRGKGRRRRTVTTTTYRTVTTKVRTSAPNSNIKPIRDAIIKYGQDNKVAVYDWWNVAGGSGASNTWIKNGLFSPDKVHHSVKGYRLQGRLSYDALIKAIQSK